MRRKEFLKLGAGFLMTPPLFSSFIEKKQHINIKNQGSLDRLGGMSLQELLDFHRDYLLKTYIPNLERGVDWKYGGFADSLKPGQEPNFDRKCMYYQSRAVWVFSYLYNHITADISHLEAAVKGRDFLIKHALTNDSRWVSIVTRQGKHLSEPLDHYGDIYMVLGLTELYKATKDEKDLNLAIQTAHSVMKRLVSTTYQHTDAHGPALEPGTRRIGGWTHLLAALTPLLKVQRDQEIERIARYCVRVVCERHWLPEYGVFLEYLDDHFRPYTTDASGWGLPNLRMINAWHNIQISFLLMDEALRVQHYPTFRQGMDMGILTLQKCYVNGKGLMNLDNPEAIPNPEELHAWGSLDDMLVYCLMVLEYTHDPMVISYYNKCFEVYYSKPENFTPQCLLHIPRRLFYSIDILNRMIKNGGRVFNICR